MANFSSAQSVLGQQGRFSSERNWVGSHIARRGRPTRLPVPATLREDVEGGIIFLRTVGARGPVLAEGELFLPQTALLVYTSAMLYQATTKVPGGKFIRAKVEADAVINAVRINGDFFLHPEESLPAIEKCLVGQTVPSNEKEGVSLQSGFAVLIHGALARENAAFLGVSPEDIARTVLSAFCQPQTDSQKKTGADLLDNPSSENQDIPDPVAISS